MEGNITSTIFIQVITFILIPIVTIHNIAIIAHVGRHIECISEKVILADSVICASRNQSHAPTISFNFITFYE